MSRSRRGKKAGEDAERLLQEAFGVSEDQLLKDFILAQTEVKTATYLQNQKTALRG